jgi:hypothetical protein
MSCEPRPQIVPFGHDRDSQAGDSGAYRNGGTALPDPEISSPSAGDLSFRTH